jgi:hypothetical protein
LRSPITGDGRRATLTFLSVILLVSPLLAQEEVPPSDNTAAPAAESPFPSTQTAPAKEPQQRLEISDDPTYLRTSLRGIVEDVQYVGDVSLERLRIRYLQTLGKRDAILADIPFGRVDPGAGFSSSYGSGDLSLQYLHLFPSKSRTLLQAGGAIFVLKTASDTALSAHTALYGVVRRRLGGLRRIQPYLVLQYTFTASVRIRACRPDSLVQLRTATASASPKAGS